MVIRPEILWYCFKATLFRPKRNHYYLLFCPRSALAACIRKLENRHESLKRQYQVVNSLGFIHIWWVRPKVHPCLRGWLTSIWPQQASMLHQRSTHKERGRTDRQMSKLSMMYDLNWKLDWLVETMQNIGSSFSHVCSLRPLVVLLNLNSIISSAASVWFNKLLRPSHRALVREELCSFDCRVKKLKSKK